MIQHQQLLLKMPGLKVSLVNTALDGRITAKQLIEHCPDAGSCAVYLCGPQGLITTSRDLLIALGVHKNHIHHELFGPVAAPRNFKTAQSRIFFNQSKTVINADDNQQTLLELAEASNTHPPSGCRMGVCHQCKCHKRQGVVYNTLTQTYSDTGAEDIQLCISVAVGDVTLEL